MKKIFTFFAAALLATSMFAGNYGILVNGKIVNIPSYQVKAGDTISVKEGSKKMVVILDALNEVAKAGTAPWISVDVDAQRGTFNALPRREEVTDLADVKEQLVVELYSK